MTTKRTLKEGEECIPVHLWLYASDVQWVDAQCAGGWDNASTRSKFIRLGLRRLIRAMQAKADNDARTLHATPSPPSTPTPADKQV